MRASKIIPAAFALATLAYGLMLAHVVFAAITGQLGIFTMFGAPAALALLVWYLLSNPPARERWAVLAAAIALEWLRVWAMQAHGIAASVNNLSVYFGSASAGFSMYFGFAYGFGLGAGMAVTGALWLRAKNNAAKVQMSCLMLMQVALIYSMYLVSLVSVRTHTVDDQLQHFEAALGVYVPAQVGIWFEHFPLLAIASQLAYATLAAGVLVTYFLQERQRPRPPVNVLVASGIAALAAGLYFIVPACGPLEVFGPLFPHAIPLAHYGAYTHYPAASLWRNAMPSLHSTWALLLWIQLFYYHPNRLAQWGSAVFVVLVLLSTLGTGAHYFVDLVVAVPLTLAVQALASTRLSWHTPARWQAVAAGCSMVAAWLLLLCHAPGFFGFWRAWTLVALTVVICWALLLRLVAVTKI